MEGLLGRFVLLLPFVLLVVGLGCAPDAPTGDRDSGPPGLPVHRPAEDGGRLDDAGPGREDAGPPPACAPEIAGERFGVCGGRFTDIEETVSGARFGVSGAIERAPAKAEGGRFGLMGGGIHVP